MSVSYSSTTALFHYFITLRPPYASSLSMPCLYARINKKLLIILNPTIETGTPQRTSTLNIQWNIVITSTLLCILLLRTATMWSNSPHTCCANGARKAET